MCVKFYFWELLKLSWKIVNLDIYFQITKGLSIPRRHLMILSPSSLKNFSEKREIWIWKSNRIILKGLKIAKKSLFLFFLEFLFYIFEQCPYLNVFFTFFFFKEFSFRECYLIYIPRGHVVRCDLIFFTNFSTF